MGTTLKERLALALKEAPGVQKADLARACGIKPASVSNWFSGKSKSLAGMNLLRVARALNVNPDWLGTGRGTMRLNGLIVNEAPPKNSQTEVTSEAQSPRLDLPTLHEAFTLLLQDEDQGGVYRPLLDRTKRLFELYQRVEADGGRLSAASYGQFGKEIEQRRGTHERGVESRGRKQRH